MNDKGTRVLYVTALLSREWGGGEPLVARKTIELLKNLGYNVVSVFYKSKLGYLFTRISGPLRAIFPSSDSWIFSYMYYKKVIEKENPNVIIAQYDYDSSIIKAAVNQRKRVIAYVHIWWPICPKITLFTYDNQICSGFTGNNCKICLLHSVESKSIFDWVSKRVLFLLKNSMIHKKMKNRINFLNRDNVTIAVLSSRMKAFLVGNGLSPEKIRIIPNSVSCEEFYPNDITREKIVGYYGGESHLKGYEVFLKVAETIKARYPDVRFLAAGYFKNKSPFVEFIGSLTHAQVAELMGKSLCTVIPSITEETFNLVALESMATGTPPVAFDVGILKSIILDNETGFIVPVMAINDMINRIIDILTDDRLFLRLSKNSRIVACEFTENKRIDLLNKIILESERL